MAEMQYDARLIERLARMYEGNAAMHSKRVRHEDRAAAHSRWFQDEMLAASSLAIAASYWSLIAPRNALSQYRKAAEIYRSMGHNYWVVLEIVAASEREISRLVPTIDEISASQPELIGFAMVTNELFESEHREARSERLNLIWQRTGNVPSGRLAIPLDYYGRWAQGIRSARSEKNAERFLAECAIFVERASEVLRLASHDRFHWTRLQTTILPAEPEVVAMTKAMSMISHSLFRKPLIDIPNLDEQGRLLVRIGEEMRRAAIEPEPQAA